MTKKNLVKKFLLLILVCYGFCTSLLYLQDRATNPRYLIPVKVRILTTKPFQAEIDFLAVSPNGQYDDSREHFRRDGSIYSFESSIIMKSFAFRMEDPSEINKISKIELSLKEKRFDFDRDTIPAHWEIHHEKGAVLLQLKDAPRYSKSILSLLGSHYTVMNWPGDKAFLLAFLRDTPWLFLIPLILFAICIFVIAFEATLQRLLGMISLSSIPRRSQLVLLFFSLFMLGLLIRLPTLNQASTVDEGTFLTIADRIAKGAVLYRDVWDSKSPGFFFYYAFLLTIFRNLIFVKIMGLLLVSSTAFVLSRIAARLFEEDSVALSVLSGITYVLLSSVSEFNYNVSPEQLVVFFSSLALWLILKDRAFSVFFASLLLGMSFVCKYTAGLDIVAMGIMWLVFSLRRDHKTSELLGSIGASLAGFLLPSVLVALYFHFHSTLSNWIADNIGFDLYRYSEKLSVRAVFHNLVFLLKGYWPFVILVLIGLTAIPKLKGYKKTLLVVTLWGLSSLVAVFAFARVPPHENYFFQLWGVFSLIIPVGALTVMKWLGETPIKTSRFLIPSVVLSALAVLYSIDSAWIRFARPNYLKEMTDYISVRIQPQDQLFVLDSPAETLYFYLDKMPPTKFISGLARSDEEIQRIFKLGPRFFVCRPDYDFKQQWITEFRAFTLASRFGPFDLYERNPLPQ